LNNSLSALASIVNPALAEAMAAGDIHILAEYDGFNGNGNPFDVILWDSKPVDPDCDFTTQSCAFWVQPWSIDEVCEAKYTLGNASLNGGTVHGGGPGFYFPLQIPLTSETTLDLILYNAEIQADVLWSGDVPQSASGVIGGAILKSDLMAAIAAVPEDQLPTGLSTAGLMSLINLVVTNDVDVDGDGTLDAASIGLKFTAGPASILGVWDP
jgi:hypothetical protein